MTAAGRGVSVRFEIPVEVCSLLGMDVDPACPGGGGIGVASSHRFSACLPQTLPHSPGAPLTATELLCLLFTLCVLNANFFSSSPRLQ